MLLEGWRLGHYGGQRNPDNSDQRGGFLTEPLLLLFPSESNNRERGLFVVGPGAIGLALRFWAAKIPAGWAQLDGQE